MKEWFVLVDDRYRGPYSQEQIVSTIEQGGLKSADLVWREGMLDWETLAQVAEFSIKDDGAKADPQLGNSALSFLDYLEPEDEPLIPRVIVREEPAATPAPAAPPPLAFNPDFWLPEEKKLPFFKQKWALVGVAVATVVCAGALWQFNRAGFPVLKDVPARELADLKSAAAEDPAAGDFAAVAVTNSNLLEPRFYLAANGTDGETYEVQLRGQRETMVDSFYYSSAVQVKIKNHYAKTPGFVGLTLGEYTLTVLKNGVQIAQKNFFLGGVKDASYESRLKAYQAKVHAQGEAELAEIRQVTDLLEKQFNETQQRYKSGKGWEKFHQQWTALQDQVEILFKDVSPDTLHKEFYQGPLYLALSEATRDVSRLHSEQNNAFTLGAPDREKLAEATRAAQARLLTMRAKLLQAERRGEI